MSLRVIKATKTDGNFVWIHAESITALDGGTLSALIQGQWIPLDRSSFDRMREWMDARASL